MRAVPSGAAASSRTTRRRSGSASAASTGPSRISSFVEPTRQEPGCLEYHFHEDRDEPGVFVFYEAWRTQADLDAHLALPHMRAFWERRMEYLESDLDIRFLTMHSPYWSAAEA
ncbi:putative quinol monooxygenase [Streptomyces sp. NPDC054866]